MAGDALLLVMGICPFGQVLKLIVNISSLLGLTIASPCIYAQYITLPWKEQYLRGPVLGLTKAG
jgi:hypothetical protein